MLPMVYSFLKTGDLDRGKKELGTRGLATVNSQWIILIMTNTCIHLKGVERSSEEATTACNAECEAGWSLESWQYTYDIIKIY